MHADELMLAECLLREHFGVTVQSVGRLLLLHGSLTLHSLLEEVEAIDFTTVRNALLILLQHNLVQPCIGGDSHLANSIRYSIHALELMQRIRFAHFMHYAQVSRGRAARWLLCEVMKYGRATLPFAVEAALQDTYNRMEAEGNPNEEEELTVTTLKFEFIKLLANNMLFVCEPNCMPLFDSSMECQHNASALSHPSAAKTSGKRLINAEATQKKKRGAKSIKQMTAIQNEIYYEKDEEEDLNTLPKEILHMMSDISTVVDGATNTSTSSKPRDPFYKSATMREQKLEEIIEKYTIQKTLFRVNTDHLTFQLCKQLAENFMFARMGNTEIVRIMIRALLSSVSRSSQMNNGRGTGYVKTNYLSFDELLAVMQGSLQSTQTIPKSTVLRLLEAFVRHPDRTILMVKRENEARYAIDWDKLRSILQHRVLFDVVQASCGDNASRVWSLLTSSDKYSTDYTETKCWDDQTIAETVLLPPHVARETIYKLADAGMARLHESDIVCKSNSTAVNKHSLLVSSSIEQCKQKALHNFNKILLNLFECKKEERRRALQLVYGLREMSETDQKQFVARERGEDILESHVLNLDKPLMILRDF